MNKRILIIDDAATVRTQVAQTLEPEGFEVVAAADGIHGIEALKTERDLALVILDVNMPGVTGLGVLEWVSKEYPGKPPPIVMMTTEVTPSLIEKAKRSGARGWVVKPFKPEHLVALARRTAGTQGG